MAPNELASLLGPKVALEFDPSPINRGEKFWWWFWEIFLVNWEAPVIWFLFSTLTFEQQGDTGLKCEFASGVNWQFKKMYTKLAFTKQRNIHYWAFLCFISKEAYNMRIQVITKNYEISFFAYNFLFLYSILILANNMKSSVIFNKKKWFHKVPLLCIPSSELYFWWVFIKKLKGYLAPRVNHGFESRSFGAPQIKFSLRTLRVLDQDHRAYTP